MSKTIAPSRLHPSDLLRIGSVGLRTRRMRAALSALGIAIGIAAMVAVLGISESSRADLISALDRLGTNLLRVNATGGLVGGSNAELPAIAEDMVGRIDAVEATSAMTSVDTNVYRTDRVPLTQGRGISVRGADPQLLDALSGNMAQGRFLDAVSQTLPVVVLGSVAAERLGITDVSHQVQVSIGGQWFSVIGILDDLGLAPDIDRSVLVGRPVAEGLLGSSAAADAIYLRVDPGDINEVTSVLAATVNPENPDQVEVSRPSDAIAARAAASSAFTSLFLGLGLVALLVGGVGIANVMVISVLERRSEIGLRRALGATQRIIRTQFLLEALLLAGLGGVAGAVLGGLVTAGYGLARGWEVVVPPVALFGGVGAALVIGAVAGLYPAMRAARLSPTEALRTV